MVERGEHFGFALEAINAVRITGELIGQNLDPDFTLQLRIAYAVDFAHPSATKLGRDFVRPKLSTDRDQNTTSLRLV
jgi:hypothetical protein